MQKCRFPDGHYLYLTGKHVLSYNPDDIPEYHYKESSYKKLATDPIFSARNQIVALGNYEFAEYKAEYLKRLINLAKNKSKNIVILQPPLRNEYIRYIYHFPQLFDAENMYSVFISSLSDANVHTIVWERPEDCGLSDAAFIDYGHFSSEGAYAFTQVLFNELRKRGIIE